MQVTSLGDSLNFSAAESSVTDLADNFDDFLHILTIQLQNQDPLDPLDANQFTDQLVQFTGVEQSIATNKHLEDMIALASAAEFTNAVGYIGKTIEADMATNHLAQGQAEWRYELAGEADKVTLTVVDAANMPVFTTSGETGAGKHTFTWNGIGTNGQNLADGEYALQVTAVDKDGNKVSNLVSILGTVDAVEVANGTLVVKIGDVDVPIASLMKVSEPAEAGEGA
jgi:flagellar basal-body rod modification protein FlgD